MKTQNTNYFAELVIGIILFILCRVLSDFTNFDIAIFVILLVGLKHYFSKIFLTLLRLKSYIKPKHFGWLLYSLLLIAGVTYLATRVAGKYGYSLALSSPKTSESKEKSSRQSPDINEVSTSELLNSECTKGSTFCSDFSNVVHDFDKVSDFIVDDVNPRAMFSALPVEGDPDNALLWVKGHTFSPILNFTLVTKLLDKNKGNLTINYGKDWRCVIGENDHNRVVCEEQYDKLGHEGYLQTLSSKSKPPIPEDSELTITGSVTLDLESNFNVKLLLTYFDKEGSEVKVELDDYKLKYNSSNIKTTKKPFAVGIIDPLGENIQVEFLKLEIFGGL